MWFLLLLLLLLLLLMMVLFLLLVNLYRFHHVKFGEAGLISVGDNIAIHITPFILFEDNLLFIPVEHTNFIKTACLITDKNKLIKTSFI